MEILAQTEAPVIRSHPIRRFLCAICAFLIALSFMPSVAVAGDIPTFTITGTGWGHGIGMSQYGSYGFAKMDWTYDDILAHYYTDTTLGTIPSLTVKVNIDKNKAARSSWTLRGYEAVLQVTDGAKTATLRYDRYHAFSASGDSILVDGKTFDSPVMVTPVGGSPPLIVVQDESGPPYYEVNYARYRGSMELNVSGTTGLTCVNYLPIDEYLYGVVPREMPSSWLPEALKVQAVAARSYGYADIVAGNVLWCTTSSQVYAGHSYIVGNTLHPREVLSTNQVVDDTTGQVVTYGGAVCKAYFFSQSGGHTANCEDVWFAALPWARGVPDTYEYLVNPPYSPWPEAKQKTYTGLELAYALSEYPYAVTPPGAGSTVAVVKVSVDRADSGHARNVTFEFNDVANTATTISGDRTRSALGLLSTVFQINGFPISRIYGGTRYETAVEVSERSFAGTAPAVVVASGQAFPDALVGSGVAGAVEGSLLLAPKSYLPDAVKEELERLDPADVYVMGGEGAIDSVVFAAIEDAVPDATVQRIQGADRYATSEAAARFILGQASPERAIIVSGESWADGAAASAFSYGRAVPVLLTPPSALHSTVASYLADAAPETTFIIGGTAAVSSVVATAVGNITGEMPTRLCGSDRYATATALATYLIANDGFDASDVYLATGFDYADALAGGVLAGLTDSPLILMRRDSVPGATDTFLTANRAVVGRLWVYGGVGAISSDGIDALESAMVD